MRKLLIASTAIAAAVTTGFVVRTHRAVTSEHDATLVKDRFWCDRIPRGETEKMNVFFALSSRPRRPPIGVFEQVSMWEGHFEGFTYEQHGKEMRIVLPQSGDRETVTVSARRCHEAGMDYCLEMSGASRGVARYYSKRGWEVRSVAEANALTAKLH